MDDTGRTVSMLADGKYDEKTSQLRGTGDRIALGALIVVAGLVLYTIGLVAYRLWFHPLAKFPGPFLNKVSDVSTQRSDTVQKSGQC